MRTNLRAVKMSLSENVFMKETGEAEEEEEEQKTGKAIKTWGVAEGGWG